MQFKFILHKINIILNVLVFGFQMEKIKRKLVTVNSDMKKCEDDVLMVNKEVERIIGDKNKYSDFLWKVYRKVIKIKPEGYEGINFNLLHVNINYY